LGSTLLANAKSVHGRYCCGHFLISVVELPYPAFEDDEKKRKAKVKAKNQEPESLSVEEIEENVPA
jgi:hypothetical protein